MNINISLSEESIRRAIARLEAAKDNVRFGMEELVDTLSYDGGHIANDAYGGMATAVGNSQGDTGHIVAVGEQVIIAEFGAGDRTNPVIFENEPDVPVYPGSYSELVGSGEYAETGKWHFGGREYTYVEARRGLLEARWYIMENYQSMAKELIKP